MAIGTLKALSGNLSIDNAMHYGELREADVVIHVMFFKNSVTVAVDGLGRQKQTFQDLIDFVPHDNH